MAKQSYTVGQILTAAQMTTLQTNDYNQTVSAKVASYVLVAADAGTRITMSNASATTVTVNTALFAAGDTLTITNIGAGVCTITAGTATVSTAGSLALNQYDTGTLYFTSTGVSIWNGANPGDITSVVAGNGLSGGASSGAATLAIDTAITVDKTTAQTLTNKTLTSPALTTPTISTLTTNGDLLYGTGSGALSRLGIGSTSQVLTVTGGVPVWATPAGGGGKVLQVVQGTTSTVVYNSTSTYVDTGLTATITPTLNTSKVLVFVSQNGVNKNTSATNNGATIQLLRTSTQIGLTVGIGLTGTTGTNHNSVSMACLDAPATTSATTYKTQLKNYQNGAEVEVQTQSSISTIILMEIGA